MYKNDLGLFVINYNKSHFAMQEHELVALFIEHYSTCAGKPAIMQFLTKKLGRKVNFAKFGFGKLNEFLTRHETTFSPYLDECKMKMDVNRLTVDETELVEIIRTYGFSQAMNHIRELHGHGPFSKFGFGTYEEFCTKHFSTYQK